MAGMTERPKCQGKKGECTEGGIVFVGTKILCGTCLTEFQERVRQATDSLIDG
jgi:hypothetical protein